MPSAPELEFVFDPTAEDAVSDALLMRDAVLHHLPPEAHLPQAGIDEAAELTGRAVDASMVVYKRSIVTAQAGEPAAVSLTTPITPIEPACTQPASCLDFFEPCNWSDVIWMDQIKAEVDAATQEILFSGDAAAVTLAGLAHLTHYHRLSLAPEDRAVRKQARYVSERYFGMHYTLRRAASLVIDTCQRFVGRLTPAN